MQKQRFHNLDYLRGMAAFAVMIYHFLHFIHVDTDPARVHESGRLIARLGIYAVSVFYILSGLTLYLVYRDAMKPNFRNIKAFAMKRIFRIYPLLWLVMLLSILVRPDMPEARTLFYNATGLFGFVSPFSYVGMGMWSIGNELVFYSFFPLFMYLIWYRRYRVLGVFTALLFFAYLYFAFFKFDRSQTVESQWGTYIMPFNQIFLFASGILTGLLFDRRMISGKWLFLLFTGAAALFVYYPVSGDQVYLVTGWNRVLFTGLSLLICFCFFKTTLHLPAAVHKPLCLLGEISYSLYLLHPVVWRSLDVFWLDTAAALHPALKMAFAVSLTLVISYLNYVYFEKVFVRLGRTAMQQLRLQQETR